MPISFACHHHNRSVMGKLSRDNNHSHHNFFYFRAIIMAHVRQANDDFRFMRKLLFGNLHRPLATLAKWGT